MDAGLTWYFAYGSNMQRATFRDRRGLEAAAEQVGRLDGYTLCFDIPVGRGRRGVANLLRAQDASVWGVLYRLTPDQHARLDRTEGVHRGFYSRVEVEIETEDGAKVRAEAYMGERRDPSRGPSMRYRTILVEGAREHGLPAAYLATLEQWPLAWDEREGAENPAGLEHGGFGDGSQS